MKMPLRLKLFVTGMILSIGANLFSIPFLFSQEKEYQAFPPLIKLLLTLFFIVTGTTTTVMIFKRNKKAIYLYAFYGTISFLSQMAFISIADFDKVFNSVDQAALAPELLVFIKSYFGVFTLGVDFLTVASLLLILCSKKSLAFFEFSNQDSESRDEKSLG